MKGSVCLVTGATGFIGSHLADRLLREGATVHALVRPGSLIGRLARIADKIVIHRADLEDREAIEASVGRVRPEIVFHLAAETRAGAQISPAAARLSVRQLLDPLLNLVEALGDSPKPPAAMVRAGSIAEYGYAPLPYREDSREAPRNSYGAGLLAGTRYLEMLADKLAFPVITARLALTYGPTQSHNFLLPALIDSCLAGRDFEIRCPEDRRDLIHVDDVVDALLLLAQRCDRGHRLVNISTGRAPTMRQLAEAVISQTRCDPGRVRFGTAGTNSSPTELRSEPSLAWELFGWRASIPWEAGLARLLSASGGDQLRTGQAVG